MATKTVTPARAGKPGAILDDTVKSAVEDVAQTAVNDAINTAVEETVAPIVGEKVAKAAEEALDRGADRLLATVAGKVVDAIAHDAPRGFRHALSRCLYGACYGLSYGAVYVAVFVTELLPEGGIVRRGFADGARAARTAMNQPLDAQETAAFPTSGIPNPPPAKATKAPATRRRMPPHTASAAATA